MHGSTFKSWWNGWTQGVGEWIRMMGGFIVIVIIYLVVAHGILVGGPVFLAGLVLYQDATLALLFAGFTVALSLVGIIFFILGVTVPKLENIGLAWVVGYLPGAAVVIVSTVSYALASLIGLINRVTIKVPDPLTFALFVGITSIVEALIYSVVEQSRQDKDREEALSRFAADIPAT